MYSWLQVASRTIYPQINKGYQLFSRNPLPRELLERRISSSSSQCLNAETTPPPLSIPPQKTISETPIEQVKNPSITDVQRAVFGNKSYIWEDLRVRKNNWLKYAQNKSHNPCADITPGMRWKTSGDDRICGIGDSVLFNALLAYSGDEFARDAVRRSQHSSGRWFRSPLHFDVNGNPTIHARGDKFQFSRDHTVGVLLYLLKQPDRGLAREQARKWAKYMLNTSGIVQGIVDLHQWDEPTIDLLSTAIKSLEKCQSNLMEDGCVVHEVVERWHWVWKKVRQGVACLRDPLHCVKKFWEKSSEDIVREISHASFRVSDEDSPETILTPALLFLMQRVFRELDPTFELLSSKPFNFVGEFFDDMSYDIFMGLNVRLVNGYQLHLIAVDALIRAELGMPIGRTLEAINIKTFHNPFYQYLYRRYVNEKSYSLEEIRNIVLDMAPKTITENKENERVVFRNDDGHENTGNVWAWEKEEPALEIADSAGWDCIFMANLMEHKIEEEFEFYRTTILPQQINLYREGLVSTFNQFKEQHQNMLDSEGDLNEFIEKVMVIIKDKDVIPEELEGLKPIIVEKYDLVHAINYPQLIKAYFTLKDRFKDLDRIKKKSLTKYQNANRVKEHTDFWDSQNIPLKEIEDLLSKVKKRISQESSKSKILSLLTAISKRIEQERIDNQNSSIARMNDELINAIKQICKNKEYVRITQELEQLIEPLARQFSSNRNHFLFSKANASSHELEHAFSRLYKRLSRSPTARQFLNQQDLKQIYNHFIQFIQREQSEWQELKDVVGARGIIQKRLQRINAIAKSLYEKLQYYSPAEQQKLYFQWLLKVKESGYPIPTEWSAEEAFRHLSSWQFSLPQATTYEEWESFDVILNELNILTDDFLLTPLYFNTSERPVSFNADKTSTPSKGVVFKAAGMCHESIAATYLTACDIPREMSFRAAPVSSFQGNKELEKFTFHNRVIATFSGTSEESKAGYFIDDGIGEPKFISPSPHSKTYSALIPITGRNTPSIHFHTTPQTTSYSVFSKNTALEMEVNYVYPDLNMLELYTRSLIKFANKLGDIYRKIKETDNYLEITTGLSDGITLLESLLQEQGLDEVTKFQINLVKKRMIDARTNISHDCQNGTSNNCQNRVQQVLDDLFKELNLRNNEMTSLHLFLQDEKVRLEQIKEVDLDINRRLNEILQVTHQDLTKKLSSDKTVRLYGDRDEVISNGVEKISFKLNSTSAHTAFRNIIWNKIDGQLSDYYIGEIPFHNGTKTILRPPASEYPDILDYQGIKQDKSNTNKPKGPVFQHPERRNGHFSIFHSEPILSPGRLKDVLSGSADLIKKIRISLSYNALADINDANHLQCGAEIHLLFYDNNRLYPSKRPLEWPDTEIKMIKDEKREWSHNYATEWTSSAGYAISEGIIDLKPLIAHGREVFGFGDVGLACGFLLHSQMGVQFNELKVEISDI